ncbi:MAG: acetate--CoA ligase, partial [Achromobacter sp.]
MQKLTDFTRYADAQAHFAPQKLWDLFDGDRESFNIAHECVDRHVAGDREAIVVVHADGSDVHITFAELAALSNRFANYLIERG